MIYIRRGNLPLRSQMRLSSDSDNRWREKPSRRCLTLLPAREVWSYGKGGAAAVTTSSSRKWGAEFEGWPQYNRFWANLVRWARG
jgi:hypothetical protein